MRGKTKGLRDTTRKGKTAKGSQSTQFFDLEDEAEERAPAANDNHPPKNTGNHPEQTNEPSAVDDPQENIVDSPQRMEVDSEYTGLGVASQEQIDQSRQTGEVSKGKKIVQEHLDNPDMTPGTNLTTETVTVPHPNRATGMTLASRQRTMDPDWFSIEPEAEYDPTAEFTVTDAPDDMDVEATGEATDDGERDGESTIPNTTDDGTQPKKKRKRTGYKKE